MDLSVMGQIGLRPMAPTVQNGVATDTQRVAVADGDTMPWWSPRNPLMWIAAIVAVTVGAASVAGSVRVGKVKVSGSAG